MLNSKIILRAFHDRALIPRPIGMEVIFAPRVAKQILEECQRQRVGSLGVDGFTVFLGRFIQIHQEWCLVVPDRTSTEDWATFVARSIATTVEFIESLSGIVDGFSLVLYDEWSDSWPEKGEREG